MKNYIIGAAYTKDKSKLALIKKNRPEWQAGKYNFIGGHLERFDGSPLEGIVREFTEETGVFIPPTEWKQFGRLSGPDYDITLFKCFSDKVLNVTTTTDELVCLFDTNNIPFEACISNLAWLVPMSLEVWDKNPNEEPCYSIYSDVPAEVKPKPKPRAINMQATGRALRGVQYDATTELAQVIANATPRLNWYHNADAMEIRGLPFTFGENPTR